jgi:hypothetical protein
MSREGVRQGRLAGTVGSHDHVNLAGLHGEVETFQDLLAGDFNA